VENYKDYDQGVKEREALEGESSRVLRGGSFRDRQRLVRCASRFRPNPGYFLRYFGFRLVVSPL